MSVRHCIVRQIRQDGAPLVPEVSLGGIHIVFDPDGTGRDKENGQAELPEETGLMAEKRPGRYKVEWKDGPRPAVKAARIPRAALNRRLEPPTREEVLMGGVSEADADKAVAFQRFMHAQQVFPYGPKPLPPEGAEKMLDRFLKAKGEPEKAAAGAAPAEKAATLEGEPAPKAGKKSHYERRRDELAALVADANGGEELRAICAKLGVEASTNKREMADAVLAKEFPREHKAVAPASDEE